MKDKVQKDIERILNSIIKKYKLSDKEAKELRTATVNYDYEINEGCVFTRVETIERLFTDEQSETKINITSNQIKAMAEFIKQTKKYYIPYGYEEYTERAIDLILSKGEKEITRFEFLNEIREMINHNILCYSNNYSLGEPKKGYEKEFKRENKKLILVEEMIREAKQKEKMKNKNMETR